MPIDPRNSSHTDSSFDQSASEDGISRNSDKFSGLRQPSIITPGSTPPTPFRQVPGADGFRLADTPQAWVFLQKKQWRDDTWTYVVPTSPIEEAEEELQEARERVTRLEVGRTNAPQNTLSEQQKSQEQLKADRMLQEAKQQVRALELRVDTLKQRQQGSDGTITTAFDNKLVEIDVRTALGNIITRKLEWMNHHEKFSKVTSAVQNTIEFLRPNRQDRANGQRPTQQQTRAAENRAQNESALATSEQAKAILERQQIVNDLRESIQQINTEISNFEQLKANREQQIASLQQDLSLLPPEEQNLALQAIQDIENEIPQIDEQITQRRALIIQTQQIIREQEATIREIKTQIQQTEDSLVDELQSIIDTEFAPVTLSGNAFTRYYKEPRTRTLETDRLKQLRSEREELQKELSEIAQQVAQSDIDLNALNLSISDRNNSNEIYKALTEQQKIIVNGYARIRAQLDRKDDQIREELAQEKKSIETAGDSVFNGVMELANISQVSTSRDLDGEGTASFTIENPQNIFFISRDDVILALSEDPFIRTSMPPNQVSNFERDENTNLIFYRGRLYPERIVKMLTSRGSAGVDFNRDAVSEVFTELASLTEAGQRVEFLTTQITTLEQRAELLDQQAIEKEEQARAIQSTSQRLTSQQQSLIDAATAARAEADRVQADLEAAERLLARDTRQKEETISQFEEISRILTKYYVGKSIFEVMDRVYIWTTSPTRTPFTLGQKDPSVPNTPTTIGLEDPALVTIAQQLNRLTILREQVDPEIQLVKERLASAGYTFSDETPIEPVDDTVRLPMLEARERNPIFLHLDPSQQSTSDTASLSGSLVVRYYTSLIRERENLDSSIESLRKSNAILSPGEQALYDNLAQGKISNEQAINEYESRFFGIEERRQQVFQGVISQVTQTYSNGVYKLSVSCKDNLVFLSISRIMTTPALRTNEEPAGVLQDPIWRGHPQLKGRWKNGVVVLDNVFINDEVQENIDRNNAIRSNNQEEPTDQQQNRGISDTEGRLRFTPYATSLPFAKVDAANLVSLIVTGVPYNFDQFIKNSSFGGRLIFDRVSGATDQILNEDSFFFSLRRSIGEQNDRLGDFEPFIDTEALTSQQRIDDLFKGLVTRINSKAEVLSDKFIHSAIKRFVVFIQKAQLTKAKNANVRAIDSRIDKNTRTDNVASAPKITNVSPVTIKARTDATRTLVGQDFIILGGTQSGGNRLSSDSNNLVDGQGISIGPRGLEPTKVSSSANSSVICRQSSQFILTDMALSVFDAALEQGYQFGTEQAQITTGRISVSETCIDSFAQRLLSSSEGFFGQLLEIISRQADQAAERSSTNSPERRSNLQRQIAANLIRDAFSLDVEFQTEFLELSQLSDELQQLQKVQAAIQNNFGITDLRTAERIRKNTTNALESTVERIVKNRKKNFLVISDRYELDRTIQAYKTQVADGDFSLWQSEFEIPLSVCRRAATQVDFEFYADENGHIRFKPPTYNRILKEHFDMIAQTDGPARDAILARYGGEDGTLLQSLGRAIALTTEAIAINSNAKADLEPRVRELERNRESFAERTSPTELQNQIARTEAAARTREQNEITRQKSNIQLKSLTTTGALPDFNDVRDDVSAENQSIATEVERQLRKVEIAKQGQFAALESRKNFRIQTEETTQQNNASTANSTVQSLIEAQAPQEEIARAQQVAQNASKIGTDATTLEKIEAELEEVRDKLAIYDRIITSITQLEQQLSSKRNEVRLRTVAFVNRLSAFFDEQHIHRIQNHDLISYSLTEGAPRFTYLEVIGQQDLVNISAGGGSEFYWSGGVDYDMWRNYGFKQESVEKAYFHSGAAAKVYNRALLGRERGRIFSGNVTVRGDSKYRLGDCIFLEDQAMYYYIIGISHSFSYGQSYQTQLTLSYGRRIGEIIPHPFDVLGGIFIEAYQSDLERALQDQARETQRQQRIQADQFEENLAQTRAEIQARRNRNSN